MELLDSSSDEEVPIRQTRDFKPRINFEGLTDFQFNQSFRISTSAFEYILERIGPMLQHQTERNYALTPPQQILTLLHWLGNSCQYHGIANMHGISKSTVHRCIQRVSSSIVTHLFASEVRWPTENVIDIPQKFMSLANFPRVAVCVDGTLIAIDSPTENEAAYVDREGNHSINAMLVAGPDLQIYYASARWPGSVSDARVLRNSSLCTSWDNGWRPFVNAVLLGDSIYPLKEWLMTPLANGPLTEELLRYLRAHRSTRRIVECTIGVLKEKFPCLNHLRLEPEVACKIILTCVVIHNIEKLFKMEEINLLEVNDDIEDLLLNPSVGEPVNEANAAAMNVFNEIMMSIHA